MTADLEALAGWFEAGADAVTAAVLPATWRRAALAAITAARHGDLARWIEAVRSLRTAATASGASARPVLGEAPGSSGSIIATQDTDAALQALRPWRKGPVRFAATRIDTEWRSDWKWARLQAALGDIDGTVLDVGCGNGYYALRTLDAGATAVVGIDPTWLFVLQFLAITAAPPAPRACVLPLRLEALPDAAAFDLVLSLGVLSHRRDPARHLELLRAQLRPGGRLALETLVVPPSAGPTLRPEGRYARMRNVWCLPTTETLCGWLADTGFEAVEVADLSLTTIAEQRRTAWMAFDSLAEALDPHDRLRTLEGHPAPRRALVIARAPIC